MHCPVCPLGAVPDGSLRCPQCGADLTTIRRVQELPWALLHEGLQRAKRGEARQAAGLLHAAAVFPQTREPSRRALENLEGRLRAGSRNGDVGAWRRSVTILSCAVLGPLCVLGLWSVSQRRVTRRASAAVITSAPSAQPAMVVSAPPALAPSSQPHSQLEDTPLSAVDLRPDGFAWQRDREAIVVTFTPALFARGRPVLTMAGKRALASLAQQLKPYVGRIALTVVSSPGDVPPGYVMADSTAVAWDQAMSIVVQMREAAGLPADVFTITSARLAGKAALAMLASSSGEVIIRIMGAQVESTATAEDPTHG